MLREVVRLGPRYQDLLYASRIGHYAEALLVGMSRSDMRCPRAYPCLSPSRSLSCLNRPSQKRSSWNGKCRKGYCRRDTNISSRPTFGQVDCRVDTPKGETRHQGDSSCLSLFTAPYIPYKCAWDVTCNRRNAWRDHCT